MNVQSPGAQTHDDGIDIATMFELSLAIGKSLDLQSNTEAFFSQILSRLNLAAIGLFVRAGRLGGQDPDAPEYRCSSSVPRFDQASRPLAHGSPVASALRDRGITQFSASEVESLRPVFSGHQLTQGALVGFAHGDDIVILLHIGWRQEPLPSWQLSQLQLVLTKFAHSVETCLDHELLRRESARRIELQEQLIRAQRLEALGLLAGGVAHDLNNILTPLLGYPALVRRALPEGSEARMELDTMEQAAGRAASMIEQLLGIASARTSPQSRVGLSRSIEDYLSSPEFQALRGRHAGVVFEADLQAGGWVQASMEDVSRVMMNLIHNAFDAQSDRGCVQVQSRDVVLSTGHRGYEIIPPGSYCRVRVQDTGCGIPSDLLGRIFEPFVSTKSATGNGSGLGLSVVYSLVKDMGGYLDLESSPAGTTFDLYLPHAEVGPTRQDVLAV